jgi:hypothetical protein
VSAYAKLEPEEVVTVGDFIPPASWVVKRNGLYMDFSGDWNPDLSGAWIAPEEQARKRAEYFTGAEAVPLSGEVK